MAFRSSENGYFSVLEIHRNDLKEIGINISEVDDRQMTLLANYLGEYLVESGVFWKALRMYVRKMGLPIAGNPRGKEADV